jgi:hypothetical protein
MRNDTNATTTGPIPFDTFLAVLPLREFPLLCPARSRRS